MTAAIHKNCLVAGPTCSGKTVLATRLVERHGFSRIPGDPLVLAFQEAFPELGIGHGCADSDEEQAYSSTCRAFGRFLVRLVNALSWESSMPYVLDTFHARPMDLAGVDLRKTTVLFLGYPNAEPHTIISDAKKYQTARYGSPVDWMERPDTELVAMFSLFARMSSELQRQCEGTRYTFVDTGMSFDRALDSATECALAGEKVHGQ